MNRLATIAALVVATAWALLVGMIALGWHRELFPPSPPMGGADKLYYDAAYDKLAEPSTASLANCSGTASTGDRLGHLQLDITQHPIPGAAARVLTVCGTNADLEPWSQEKLDAGARDAELMQFGQRVRDSEAFDLIHAFFVVFFGLLALGPLLLIALIVLLYRLFRHRPAQPVASDSSF